MGGIIGAILASWCSPFYTATSSLGNIENGREFTHSVVFFLPILDLDDLTRLASSLIERFTPDQDDKSSNPQKDRIWQVNLKWKTCIFFFLISVAGYR